jgi:hypothetical protein
MADEPKPPKPMDDARDALRRAKKGLGLSLKAASVVLGPAANAAKRVAWDARRAVQPERIADEVNKVLGLEPRHEVEVSGEWYRIAKVAADRFEVRTVPGDTVCGRFACLADGRIRMLETDGDIRQLLDIAEKAVAAGLAP